MPCDLSLIGPRIRLRPLESGDADALVRAAADGTLWQLAYTVVPGADTVHEYIDTALRGRDDGAVMPFVTEDLASGAAIGSTRFWKIDCKNRKLEIGHTWLSVSWQRSYANTDAKYLMLRHAFEVLDCVRVQFTTDERNEASRNAILRLGAQQEGIVRHERVHAGRKKTELGAFQHH